MYRPAATVLAMGAIAFAAPLAGNAHEGHEHHGPRAPAAEHGEHHHDGGEASYGHPGRAQDVTRSVTLIATEMRYSESDLTVTAGETIRFVLVNKGRQDHELMIADEKEQLEHRSMMLSMEGSPESMHHHDNNVIEVKPGETKELIWTFTQPGVFEYACNFPGHAEKGMSGKITVKPASDAKTAADEHGEMHHHDMDHGDMHGDMNHGDMHGMQHDDGMMGMAHDHGGADDGSMHDHHGMEGHGGMAMRGDLGPYPMTREASGTSWQPDASSDMGNHVMLGDWMVMGHALINAVYDWQGGPRGDDKGFVAGMLMAMAQRDLGDGNTLALRAMLSPDPFMGKSGYPLLLAAGETADGTTHLVDRQHPHDLFMELAASFSHRIGDDESVFIYGGLPGEPAFGPPAFMHRMSTMDSPEAPITHHWFDSTHITFGVLTAGFVKGDWKAEVSGFRGRETDQDRFDIETPKLDSWSARLSWNPTPNWALQVSWADVHSPEQLEPDVDETRLSTSAIYTVKLGEQSWWSTTVGWALKDPSDRGALNAFMLESAYAPDNNWTMFGRVEAEENAELSGNGRRDTVGKLSLGVIRDFAIDENVKLGIGALVSRNFIPNELEPSYDGDPNGAMVFLRLKASS